MAAAKPSVTSLAGQLLLIAAVVLAVNMKAATAAKAVSVASGPLDATAIYDRARAAVAARTIPPIIAYTQYAAFLRHGRVRAELTRVVLRTADGKVNLTPLPVSPGDHVASTPVVKDRPLVYPTTTFGLVRRRTGETASTFESRSTPVPEPNGPPVIGRVVSTSRDYDSTFSGTENIDGVAVYHLVLTPRFDPEHHPIRAMWVDTLTYQPRRIAIEVWAKAGPIRSRPTVSVDFAPVGGVWLISHAAMDFVLRFAFFNYGGSAEFRISDVSYPASEPNWLFDRAALAPRSSAAPLAPASDATPQPH